MSEAAAPPVPPDPVPPLIVFAIPGAWRDPADLAARLAAVPGGYVLDGHVVRDAAAGRAYGCDLEPRSPGLADAFFAAAGGRARRADALAVGNHASVVRLTGFGGSVAAAVEMMRVASVVLAAGGIAVLVESSGLAHTRDDWLKLAGGRDPGGVYWAYVTLVHRGGGGAGGTDAGAGAGGGAGEHYSCGMHALGHRDVVTGVAADATDAWAICHQFNGYVYQGGRAIADGDPVGNEHGAPYRVRAEPCDRYPPDHPYHNPYGMWRVVRSEAFPTLS